MGRFICTKLKILLSIRGSTANTRPNLNALMHLNPLDPKGYIYVTPEKKQQQKTTKTNKKNKDILQFMSNGLMIKTLDSQSRGPVFKGRLSLSHFRGRSNEYQEFLGTYC